MGLVETIGAINPTWPAFPFIYWNLVYVSLIAIEYPTAKFCYTCESSYYVHSETRLNASMHVYVVYRCLHVCKLHGPKLSWRVLLTPHTLWWWEKRKYGYMCSVRYMKYKERKKRKGSHLTFSLFRNSHRHNKIFLFLFKLQERF